MNIRTQYLLFIMLLIGFTIVLAFLASAEGMSIGRQQFSLAFFLALLPAGGTFFLIRKAMSVIRPAREEDAFEDASGFIHLSKVTVNKNTDLSVKDMMAAAGPIATAVVSEDDED
jgi:hypothetical protein